MENTSFLKKKQQKTRLPKKDLSFVGFLPVIHAEIS